MKYREKKHRGNIKHRWIIVLLVFMGLGVCWHVYTIGAKHAKKVVYSVQERDARDKNILRSLFPSEGK